MWTNFYGVFLRHIRAEYVQFHQIGMTGIRASQKEKVLIRLLYRTCGSGYSLLLANPIARKADTFFKESKFNSFNQGKKLYFYFLNAKILFLLFLL